jgi:hypothetical protein
MATIKGNRAFEFKLFGYSFLIWKQSPRDRQFPSHDRSKDSCKIIRYNDYIALAMPDGTVIPYQTDLEIKAPLNAVATAKIEVFVTLDK